MIRWLCSLFGALLAASALAACSDEEAAPGKVAPDKVAVAASGATDERVSAVLSDEQILDTVAWFQDRWSDEIYAPWSATDTRSRQAAQ